MNGKLLMKLLLASLCAILLFGCKDNKSGESLEIISYCDQVAEGKENKPFAVVIWELYGQVKEDGSCILNINDYREKPKFVSFKIKSEILDSVMNLIRSTRSDTAAYDTVKSGWYLYDGPQIELIGSNSENKKVSLRFLKSQRSNAICFRFYNYLDSVGRTCPPDNTIDTLAIVCDKKKLVDKKYLEAKSYVEKYWRPSIKFVAPKIPK